MYKRQRLDLIGKNVAILKSIIPQITATSFEGILMIVSNPVDVLTYACLLYTSTYAGQGLGVQADGTGPVLKPVLTYEIRLPEGSNVHEMLLRLRELGEEIPELNIVWNEQSREIHAQVMGEVQLEILKSMIASRYGVDVEFGPGSIVYKETIAEAVEGVGHFEPLRHYRCV